MTKLNFVNTMKAFVTGATGFVGSHLVDLLLENGFEVTCLRRKTSSVKWLEGKNVNFIEGDLYANDALEKAVKNVDYVFHVAGVVKAKNKEGFERGNNLATKNLVEITARVNPNLKKFVYVSSLAVCGPNLGEEPLTEDFIPKPLTTYGRTKREAEKEVLKYRDKIPVVIVRPPAIYGPRDTEILVYFKTFARGLNSIIGFNDKYLSLLHVKDVVMGIYLAGIKETKSGDVFFISSDLEYNWDDIGKAASKVMNKKALKLRIPHFLVYTVGATTEFVYKFSKSAPTLNLEKCLDITRDGWFASNAKAKKILGFRESFTLEEGFKDTYEWYKQQGWLK
ncbi:MAG: NAD-dependent epimerase/dehydratase family protein [Candidatus Kapaibacterium sp.]